MKGWVVINADDLGLSEGINDGIFEAIDAGVVSDVSLLANGEAFEHALAGLRARGIKTVGLHFCLVDKERPLTWFDGGSVLLGSDQLMLNRNHLFARCLTQRRRYLGAIRQELDAQVMRVEKAGFLVSHIDSHQHTHLFPGITEVVLDYCQRQRRIPIVRAPSPRISSPITGVVALLSWRLRRMAARRGVQFAVSLGFETSGRITEDGLHRLLSRAARLPLCEVMVHPGHADERTRRKYAHWAYDWDRELAMVLTGCSAIETLGLRVVSFHRALTN